MPPRLRLQRDGLLDGVAVERVDHRRDRARAEQHGLGIERELVPLLRIGDRLDADDDVAVVAWLNLSMPRRSASRAQASAARETTSLPISVVPPAEMQTIASRKSRCTGYSSIVPQPPWISIAFLAACTAASVT